MNYWPEMLLLILNKTVFVKSSSYPKQIGIAPEVITDHDLINCLSSYLSTRQNIFLNGCSLRSFASLTQKHSGSYIQVLHISKPETICQEQFRSRLFLG